VEKRQTIVFLSSTEFFFILFHDLKKNERKASEKISQRFSSFTSNALSHIKEACAASSLHREMENLQFSTLFFKQSLEGKSSKKG
jgi:hypothetical protein